MKIVRDSKGRYRRGSQRHLFPILDRYQVDSETGCWNWLGALNKGYGRCKWNNKTQGAHRVFYEVHVGPIPAGLHIDHLCRNRACVNPAHLEPVTIGENIRRGTHTKLSIEDARQIRLEIDRLCKQYGVAPRTLAAVAEGAIWKEG